MFDFDKNSKGKKKREACICSSTPDCVHVDLTMTVRYYSAFSMCTRRKKDSSQNHTADSLCCKSEQIIQWKLM